MPESTAIAVTQQEAIILEHVFVNRIDRTELVHLHIDDPLHITSFKSIPGDLFRECRQL